MYKSDDDDALLEAATLPKISNYTIEPNDRIELKVYTKKGEFLIDPEFKLIEGQIPNNTNIRPDLPYLVNYDGTSDLPMVGRINLSGLTLMEAQEELVKKYREFYVDPFVWIQFANKRVTLLGAYGNQVVPLLNENTRIAEVLASAGPVEREAKAYNIRLMRKDKMYKIDFSSVEVAYSNNVVVAPGDVIYVEPVRRPFTEFIRDNGPIISVVASLTSVVAVLISVN